MYSAEELEKLPNSELIQILCKKYDVEQIPPDEMTPECIAEYLRLTHKSLENIMRMSLKIHDMATASMAGLIIKSMHMGPALHTDLSLLLTSKAKKFIEQNS